MLLWRILVSLCQACGANISRLLHTPTRYDKTTKVCWWWEVNYTRLTVSRPWPNFLWHECWRAMNILQ